MSSYNATKIALLAAMVSSLITAAHAHGNNQHNAGVHGAHGAMVMPAEQKAWGIAGDLKKVDRVITIQMTDNMRFTPNQLTVKKGETIRFEVKNAGAVMHEMVIGTKQELDQHAAMMKKHPNMEHDEPYMAHVGPKKAGQLIWQFNREGDFDFACLIAGHYEAGMVGKIRVTP